VDGYAVRAADTYGALEERPRRLRINEESIATGGIVPAAPRWPADTRGDPARVPDVGDLHVS
jgi:hypothetical protein